jgi:uncharacterized membrane protein required for colicin V production/cell division septation protein DedD
LNQGAKQRIVGTVVLLALALIFLPIIFDGEGSYQAPVSSRIPDTPIISILPEPTQSRPVIIGNVETIEPEVAATVSLIEEVTELVEEPSVVIATAESVRDVEITESAPVFSREVMQLSDAGLPQGWVVRLGSFSDSENASNLVTRLQDAGYKAYSRVMRSSQEALTGVFVGPWLDRGQVNEYQQKLQEEFSLVGQQMAFNQVDIVILIITVLSSAFGLWRGLIKEVLSLLTWIAALLVSRVYSEPLAGWMTGMIENDGIRYVSAFAILFFIVMMFGTFLNSLLSKLLSVTGLKLADRLLGAGFGVARGVIIVLVIMFIASMFVSETELWQQSQLVPYGMDLIERSQVFIGDMNSVSPTP